MKGMMRDRENTRSNILIVDPERDTGELFARSLETHRDCKCYLASDETEVMSLLKDIRFELVLADLSLLMAVDFALLKRIRKTFPNVRVIADGYLHQRAQLTLALAHGAEGTIIKPIKVDLFRRQIDAFCMARTSRVS